MGGTFTEGGSGDLGGGEEGEGQVGGGEAEVGEEGAGIVDCPAIVPGGREAGRELVATAATAEGPGVGSFTCPPLSLGSRVGAVKALGGTAAPSTSSRRRFGSMRASLLLSSRSKAPGPRCLALLVGAGGGAAECAAREGARVPGSTPCLLGWQPPLLGAWLPFPGTWAFTFRVT